MDEREDLDPDEPPPIETDPVWQPGALTPLAILAFAAVVVLGTAAAVLLIGHC